MLGLWPGLTRFLDDPRLSSHIVPLGDYYTDLAQGTLPENVSGR